MSVPIRIQRQRTKGWRMPKGALYVGRPTQWGNPWVVGSDAMGTRPDGTLWDAADCVYFYRRYAQECGRFWWQPLQGHDLACWCPLVDEHGTIVPCHADVLLELANRDEGDRLLAPDREDV